jgi:rfaE bifunctional protein kinase chain/domain
MTQDFILDQILPIAPRLFSLIEQFKDQKVLVIGDLTLDEFLTGEVERVSREAPVLILRHEFTKQVPGGGANAIYNFAKLGAQVKAVGLVGQDSQAQVLVDLFLKSGIDVAGILVDPERPTVTKTRIAGHARQSVTQQIVRVDRKSDLPPRGALQEHLAQYISSQLANVTAVVCSDYGDGVLGRAVIESACNHPRVIVDA